jgi:hypothetical protein
MFLRGSTHRELVRDIGRQARLDVGLVKLYENGASVWRKADPAPDA